MNANTKHTTLHILSGVAALATGLMASDAQVHPLLNLLPPNVARYWPALLVVAALLARWAALGVTVVSGLPEDKTAVQK